MKSKTIQLLTIGIMLLNSFNSYELRAQCHDFSANPSLINGFEPPETPNLGMTADWATEDANSDGTKWASINTRQRTGSQCMRIYVANTNANNTNDWMFSKCLSLAAGKFYRLEFYYRNIDSTQYKTKLEIKIGSSQTSSSMTQSLINLGAITNPEYQLLSLKFTVSSSGNYVIGFHATNPDASMSNIRIDDLSISEIFSTDAGVSQIAAPVTGGCGLSATEPVTVTVKNFGSDTLSNIPVYYSINGVVTGPDTIAGPLAPDSSVGYTFTQVVDLSAAGAYSIEAFSLVPGDGNFANDSMTGYQAFSAISNNISSSPFSMGFEPTIDSLTHWKIEDSNKDGGTWFPITIQFNPAAYAIDSGSLAINQSTSGPHNDWLFSPCLQLDSGKTYAVLFFARGYQASNTHKVKIHLGNAQLSTAMTQMVDSFTIRNSAFEGFISKFSVSLNGTYYMGFQDYSDPNQAFLIIDDILIYEVAQIDAGIAGVFSPAQGTCGLSATDTVRIRIRNYGLSPITGLKVSYKINNGSPVTETISGTILPDGFLDYAFSATADLQAKGNYDIEMYSAITGDTNTWNDTVSYSVESIVNDLSLDTFKMGFETLESLTGWNIDGTWNDGARWYWSGADDSANAHNGGGYYYYYSASATIAADDWLMTPCITLEAKSYSLHFWYKSFPSGTLGTDQKLELWYGPGPDNDIAGVQIEQIGGGELYLEDTVYTRSDNNFTITTAGTYYFGFHITSDADKTDFLIDDIQIDDVTSIKPVNNPEIFFSLIPNPSNGKFALRTNLPNKENLRVEVVNLLGQIVSTHQFTRNQSALDLSPQPEGVYFVKIKTSEGIVTKKVVVAR